MPIKLDSHVSARKLRPTIITAALALIAALTGSVTGCSPWPIPSIHPSGLSSGDMATASQGRGKQPGCQTPINFKDGASWCLTWTPSLASVSIDKDSPWAKDSPGVVFFKMDFSKSVVTIVNTGVAPVALQDLHMAPLYKNDIFKPFEMRSLKFSGITFDLDGTTYHYRSQARIQDSYFCDRPEGYLDPGVVYHLCVDLDDEDPPAALPADADELAAGLAAPDAWAVYSTQSKTGLLCDNPVLKQGFQENICIWGLMKA